MCRTVTVTAHFPDEADNEEVKDWLRDVSNAGSGSFYDGPSKIVVEETSGSVSCCGGDGS